MAVAKTRLPISAQEVKDFAMERGVDCVGVVSVAAVPPSVPPRSPAEALPGARSLVVFGLTMLDGCYDSPHRGIGGNGVTRVMAELDRTGYYVARMLERKGYRAAAVPAGSPFEFTEENKGLAGDISIKHAAMGAGLGVRGRNTLVVTPQWGPRIRFGVVITDASLEGDAPLEADLCQGCSSCVKSCPVGAISMDGSVDCQKCIKHYQPYGLRNILSFASKLIIRTGGERQTALRDPFVWNVYQSMLLETGFSCCFECIKSCPVGR